MIGGCFSADQCECGSLFCHGDMLRRVAKGCVLDSDCFFFVDVSGQLFLNFDLIQRANGIARNGFRRVDPHTPTALVETIRMDVLNRLGEESKGLARMHPATVLHLYHRRVREDELTLDELEILEEDRVIGRP